MTRQNTIGFKNQNDSTTQYEPIKIAIKTKISQKQNSNTNLYGSYTKFAK